MTRLVRLTIALFLLTGTVMLAQNNQLSLEIQPRGGPAGPLLVQPGRTIQFTAKAFEYTSAGTRTEVPIDKLDWSVDPAGFGSITPGGLFTPGDPTNPDVPPRGVITARAGIGNRTLEAGVKAAFDANTQHGEYTFSGHVEDASGHPIGGANVSVMNKGLAPYLITGKTDNHGDYSIKTPAGTFVVRADAKGFIAEFYDDARDINNATEFTTDENNKIISGVDFVLGTGGKIAGTVYNAKDNTPIAHAMVTAMNGRDPNGTPGNAYEGAAKTDAQGNYEISGLPTGDYIVMAEARNFVHLFYDGKKDPTQADAVAVTEGSTVNDIDFGLEEGGSIDPDLYPISGVVHDENGNALPYAMIMAEPLNSTNYPLFPGRVDQHGKYTIMVPAGIWVVRAEAQGFAREYYDNAAERTNATQLTLSDNQKEQRNIDFTLDRFGASVSGIVKDASGNGIAAARVIIWSNAGPNPAGMHPFSGKTVTKQDGSYEILGVPPGTYIVEVFAKGYLREFYDDEAEMQNAKAVQVANNQNVTGIDFELETGGSIKGTITDNDTGDPIEHAFVHIRSARNFTEFGARSDQNGNYEIPGLPTGDYIVFAMARGFSGEFYDDATDPANATAVSVAAPNETSGIDFALEIAPIAPTGYRGSVVAGNFGGHAPLNTIVEAVHPETGQVMVTTTDKRGDFDFHAWANAIIRARALGYVGMYAGNTRDWKRSSRDGMTGEISFVLEAVSKAGLGVIEGRITDEATNKGIPNAWVYGTDAEGNNYFSVTGPTGEYALTNTSHIPVTVMFSGVGYDATQGSAEMETGKGSLDISARRSSVTAIEDDVLPTGISLEQNYPNPFNPSTTISFSLPTGSNVRLAVYNLLGQQVAVLVSETLRSGTHNVVWDASAMTSGMYLYRLDVGGQTITKRMTLMK